MRIDFLTLFPDMIKASMGESIIGRATEAGLVDISYYQIRDYTENKQRKVDDCPYGGGPGMIMSYQPIKSAYEKACEDCAEKPYVVYMSPQGTVLTEKVSRRLSELPRLMIICGHYEGVDERVIEDLVDEEISIGDYVLTGGEIPAMALADSVARLVPGVLCSEEATLSESHTALLLEYPQYTRPAEINGMKVPEVLLGGNHADIDAWRLKTAEKRTEKKRPDLYEKYVDSQFNKNRSIYLDNSATTKQLDEVTDEMVRIFKYVYGNPSSLHSLGFEAEKELRKARKNIASVINASEDEILFTSGGTESNNTAIKGYFAANKRAGKHIIVSAVEHPSVAETAKAMEAQGFTVSYAPVNKSGVIDVEKLEEMITPETSMISVMLVNSETGAVMPVKEIAALKNRINKNIILHTDAVQAFGKIKINVKELGADMISVSGHKIHGPRGSGFLYVKKGIRIAPFMDGGGQEKGLRSGTENLAAICGLAKATEIAETSIEENYKNVKIVNEALSTMLKDRLGDKIRIITDREVSLPYILNISFAPLRAEVVLHSLESKNVFVSVGSACSSNKKSRSPVLTAMGVDVKTIDGAVRFSFSRFTTEDDIKLAYEAICKTVKELKSERFKRKV